MRRRSRSPPDTTGPAEKRPRIEDPKPIALPTVLPYILPPAWQRARYKPGVTLPTGARLDVDYYINDATRQITTVRPTRGSYLANTQNIHGETEENRLKRKLIIDSFAEAMEKRTLPWDPNWVALQHQEAIQLQAEKEADGFGEAPFPRKIPRPRIYPSLSSQKLNPSFNYRYEYTNQSGFTPPESLSPKGPLSPVSATKSRLFFLYQKQNLNRFTVPELQDLGAIDAYNVGLGENTLSNPILPLLSNYWLTPGPPMLGNPQQKWDFENPDVLMAMTPILRLCSRFITNLGTGDWWDAVLKAPRVPIDPERIPPNAAGPLFCFKRRDPEEKLSDPVDWTFLDGHIDFTFAPGTHVDIDGKRRSHFLQFRGVTTLQRGRRPLVHLAWQFIEPLMPSHQPPLSKSERLVRTFAVAKTLLHELAHAAGFLRRIGSGENYFEDESCRENGYSMEQSVFGGFTEFLPPEVREADMLGTKAQGILAHAFRGLAIFICPWPTYKLHQLGSFGPSLLSKKPPWNIISHPITLGYLEEIQQDAFWETEVKQYGAEAAKFQDKMYGHIEVGREGDPSFQNFRCEFSTSTLNLDGWENSPPPSPPIVDTPMGNTMDDSESWVERVQGRAVGNKMDIDPSETWSSEPKIPSRSQKRAKMLRNMARAIVARFQEEGAQAKRSRIDSTNQRAQQNLEQFLDGERNKHTSFRNFYMANGEELDDLIGSKGFRADLGIRRPEKVASDEQPKGETKLN